MDDRTGQSDSRCPQPSSKGVGGRLTVCIVAVFVVTLIIFVGLDVYHEARFAERLGAERRERTALLADTLTLHSVHAVVTILAFALAIHILVRRLVSRRIARIVLAIQHFRRGTWRVRTPRRVRDEIDWLMEAFRELGPDLESKLATFIEVDRKSVLALLGSRYEQRIAPPARRIIAVARERARFDGNDEAWPEIEGHALQILAELGKLGRPEHPEAAEIVKLDRSDKVVSSGWSEAARQEVTS